MRLVKGRKSFLCCLVIISMVMMVTAPVWAETAYRQKVRPGMTLKEAFKPSSNVNKAPALLRQQKVRPGMTLKEALKPSSAVNKVNKAPALPKTKGTIGAALMKAKAIKANPAAVNKALALPKPTGITAGVIKAPKQPRLMGR